MHVFIYTCHEQAKGNAILHASLEKRKQALRERRLALEQDVFTSLLLVFYYYFPGHCNAKHLSLHMHLQCKTFLFTYALLLGGAHYFSIVSIKKN